MKPLAARRLGLVNSNSDQLSTGSMTAKRPSDHGVQDEGMGRTVPGHIDESNQLTRAASTDPAEAVPIQAGLPIRPLWRMIEGLGMQGLDFGIAKPSPPFVYVDHTDSVASQDRRCHVSWSETTVIALAVPYELRDVPLLVARWWRDRYRLWRFMQWNGSGRLRAIVWDVIPSPLADRIHPVDDCGNHQWHSDLTLLRYWTPDDNSFFGEFFETFVPEDRCLYCRATRAVPGFPSY